MRELRCNCRDWVVMGGDVITDVYDEKIALSKDHVIDHKCEELVVYRQKKGLKRTYYQKIKTPIYEEPINEPVIPDDIADEENDITGDVSPFDKKK